MGCGKDNLESSSLGGVSRNMGCVCEVVKTILKIQNEAVRNDCDSCGTSCFLEPLGGLPNRARNADTRVIMLLDKLGKPFKAVYFDKHEGDFEFTPFFRVEDMFGDCCATLRCIMPVADDGDELNHVVDLTTDNLNNDVFNHIRKYKKTETCLTVDLNNFTAIQCIADVDLNICD